MQCVVYLKYVSMNCFNFFLLQASAERKTENRFTVREEAGCHYSEEIKNDECEFEAGSKPFHLGGKRFAVVKKFRGVPYVNIREYYKLKGTNRMLPGQKGVNLTAENWWKLVKAKYEISDAIREMSNKPMHHVKK